MKDCPGSAPAAIALPTGHLASVPGLSIECIHQKLGYQFERPGSWHSLHYCLHGRSQTFKVTDRPGVDGPLREGWACLVPAGFGTGWRSGGLCMRLVIRFSAAFMSSGRSVLQLPDAEPVEYPPRHDPGLEHYMGLVVQEFRVRGQLSPQFAGAFAGMLRTWLCDDSSIAFAPPPRIPRHRLSLSRLEAFIHQNAGQNITVNELAEQAGLSYHQFIRGLKREYGLTPKQLILNARIESVKRLLLDTPLPISEIAHDTGFSSQSHLTNTFRQSVGCPPGEYRARYGRIKGHD